MQRTSLLSLVLSLSKGALIASLAIGAACASPTLDDILNYAYLDQSVTMKGPQELFDVQRTIQLTKETPVGQTFVTGPETREIVRIKVFLAPNGDWRPGEGAELVLWDSAEKKVSLGRYTIWHEFRGFNFNQADWTIDAWVKPDTSYYFEISYVGSGDGKLSRIGVMNGSDAYKPGQGHLAGKESDFDLCFQAHSKHAIDRIGNLKKMFARLDLERPELAGVKQAVEKEDFSGAIAQTVAHFETARKDLFATGYEGPVVNPAFDAAEADQEMQHYFGSNEGVVGYAGPKINWRAEWAFDENGLPAAMHNGINNFGARAVFANAYLATGNPKYMRKLNEFLLEWFNDNPPPGESRIGGHPWDPVWNSLATGLRLGQLPVLYNRIHSAPDFTDECRMAFLLNLADHADTLVLKGGDASGNWALTQNTSLLNAYMNYPEFKSASKWRDAAVERLSTSLKDDYLPDGVEKESAPGYQRMAYNPIARGIYDKLVRTKALQLPFAEGLGSLLEKQAEYFMYMAMPDGFTPHLGDWGHDQTRPGIREDADRFNRKDMLYVASAGKEGVKPKELSKLYPYAGIVTMRSDWGDTAAPRGLEGDTVAPPLLRRGLGGGSYEDARYLMLHGVHFGPHGHADLNEITLYAYGRELLTDPGSHIYGAPEHAHLTTAEVHNLMTVDGEDQNKNGATAFRRWATSPVADYVSSWGKVYKSGGYNREVFYVRSNGDPGAQDYWVVRDTVEGSGTHLLEQRWHFPLESGAKLEDASLLSRTFFPDKGNLAILPVDPSRVKADMTTTDTWFPRGTTLPPEKLPTAVYTARTALPTALDTVLLPFVGQHASPVQVKLLESSPDGLATAFKIVQDREKPLPEPPPNPLLRRGGAVEDLIVLNRSAGKKLLSSEKVSFDGERLFVRRIGGKLRSVLLVNGSSVTVDGVHAIKSGKRVSWVAVSFEPSCVWVYTGSKEPGLVVPAARGRKVVVQSMETDGLLQPEKAEEFNSKLIRKSGQSTAK